MSKYNKHTWVGGEIITAQGANTIEAQLELITPGATNIAANYDTSATYNTGDFCLYDGTLYRCKDDNVTGAWNSAKWDSKPVGIALAEAQAAANSSLSYDSSQVLTEAQKTTARANIDAADAKADKNLGLLYSKLNSGNQTIFTSADVSAGEEIAYSITGREGYNGYVAFFDAEDTRLDIIGKTTIASTQTHYEGTFTIPEGFSYATVYSNSGYTDVIYIVKAPFAYLQYVPEINTTVNAHTTFLGDTSLGTTATTISGAIAEHESDISALTERETALENTATSATGYYESMSVGNADQITTDIGTTDQEPYNLRKTGGDITTGDRAYQEKIVGGTICWNQLGRYVTPASTAPCWGTITDTEFVEMTDNSITVALKYFLNYWWDMPSGHKVLVSFDIMQEANSTNHLCINYGGNIYDCGVTLQANVTTHIEKIGIQNGASYNPLYIYPNGTVEGSNVGNFTISNLQIFDLTRMFGATVADLIYGWGNDGLAWFKERFPKPYYEFNAGEMMSVKVAARKTTGFNLWDGEWELGYYHPDTGAPVDEPSHIRSKNPLPCLPNTSYYFNCTKTGISYLWMTVRFYDANMNYLGYRDPYSPTSTTDANYHNPFTSPANARYMKFYLNTTYGTTVNDDICLSISSERNGQYESPDSRAYTLDPSITLRGLWRVDASGNIYFDGDEYYSDGTVVHNYVETTYNGSENWVAYALPGANTAGAQVPIVPPAHPWRQYLTTNLGIQTQETPVNSTIYGITQIGNTLFITFPTSMFADVDAWKTYLNTHNLTVVRKSPNPTTETAPSYPSPQIIDPYGVEEYVDGATRDVEVPVGHKTFYPVDLKSKLEALAASGYATPEEYGAKGDGVTDDTAAIQAAVNSGAPIVFAPKTYLVSVNANNGVAIPITNNNTVINLNGATIQLAANTFSGYGIFGIDQRSKVSIMNGTIIGDKATHLGSLGEWGHGISINKCTDIALENLTIMNCWGDGIYIGNDSTSTTHNDYINIHNIICDGNRRNGMSIIDGKHIFVSDSAFNNTTGTDPQDGVDIEPNDANSVFSVMFENVVCEGNGHFGFDVNNDHGASNSIFNINHLVTDGMRLRSAGQNTQINLSDITNNWVNAANAIDISNHYMNSIIKVDDMYIDCSSQSTAKIAVLFDGDYQHNIKFNNLTVANGTVSRVTGWGRTNNNEASHVNINNLQLYNLTVTDDVIPVPYTHAINSCCSLTMGNIPPAREITLPYTAQAHSNYKIVTATTDQQLTFSNIVPGRKIYIQNATNARIRIKANDIIVDNPTTFPYFELGAGRSVVLSYEDSAATGKCHAEVNYGATYVTPEMFGAVGDGVAKDGPAVQAALNSGKTVVGSGIYNIDSDTPYSNLYYIGIPNGAHMVGGTYKFPSNGYSNTTQAVGMSAFVGNKFTIENVTFDMNGYNNIPVATTVMYCIFVDDCAGVLIKDCYFKDSAGRNYIFVKRGTEFRLENCTFHNGGTNIEGSDVTKQNDFSYIYTSADYSIVTNCLVNEPDDDPFWYCGGFEIHGNHSRVEHCEIHKCVPAIYVAQHWANDAMTYDVKILNNAFIACQGGVALYNNITLDNIEISGNYITLAPVSPVNRSMYGIGSGTSNTLSNFIVTGNTIIQHETSTYGCSGISWGNATGVKATYNILKDIPTPFWIGGSTANTDIVIEHNLITAASANAVYAITRENTSAAINRLTVCENEVKNYLGLIDSIATITDYLVLDRIIDMSTLIEKSRNIVPVESYSTTLLTIASTYKHGIVQLNGTATGGDGGRNTNLSPKWLLPAGTYSWRVTADDALPPRMMVFIQTGTTIVSQSESNRESLATFTLSQPTEVYLSINVVNGNSYVGNMYWELERGSSCGEFTPSGYTAVDVFARHIVVNGEALPYN